MASKNNITPVEITSDSSSGSSIDPTYLPYGQDLMDGQNELELLPTQDLEYSLTPKEQYRLQSRLQAKKASKSVSVSSMDMFQTEPSTSSNYEQPLMVGTIDLTNTEDTEELQSRLQAKKASKSVSVSSMDMFQSEPSTSTKYSTQNKTIQDTLDQVDEDETAAFDFPPEKKAKLASESQSQTQYSQHYTGKLTERNLKNVSEELSYMGDQLTSEKIEKIYALHCAKFLWEYLNKQDPHNAVKRKLRKEIIEKNCLEFDL